MNTKMKKSIAALGVSSLLVVGIASAQEVTETPVAPDTATEVTPEVREGRTNFFTDLVLEYTGLERDALRTALADGSTLTELIEANGMSVDDFIAAVLAEYDSKAAEARTAFQENLTALLSGEEGSLRFGGFGGFGGGPRDGQGGGGRPGDMGPGRGNGDGRRGPGADQPAPEVTPEATAEGAST